MASKREQILAAIRSTLTGTTGVGTRIYRSRVEAFQRNETPAIVIEPANDTSSSEPVSTCKIDWTLQVLIAVHTRGGAIPDQTADPILVSIHSKLMTDRTLGGLAMDIWPVSIDPQLDKADAASNWTVCTYQVRYRTQITTIES